MSRSSIAVLMVLSLVSLSSDTKAQGGGDVTPPRVIPPDDIWVSATEGEGAKAADSERLADFLDGARASDVDSLIAAPFQPSPPVFPLPPLLNGAPVGDNTLIPMGAHVVTFRFHDKAGNIGSATANVTVFDLKEGDLFVGVPTYVGPFGDSYGTVQQIRDGTVTEWCRAAYPDHMPDYFGTPSDIVVDSQGRVVFIAPVRRPQGWGLLRCKAPGAPLEKLMFIPEFSSAMERPDYPSLPDDLQHISDDVYGLHLAHEKTVVMDDDVNNGEPRIVTEDSYVFESMLAGLPCGDGCGPSRGIRYRTRSNRWEEGPEPSRPGGYGDMTNRKGETYSVSQSGLRREFNPLQVSLDAKIFDAQFSLDLFMFGGILDVYDDNAQRVIVDDTKKQDAPGMCNSQGGISTAQPDLAAHPNAMIPFGGALEVAFDKDVFQLTIGRFQGGEDGAYMTRVSQVLLDADPMNDKDGYFIQDSHCFTWKRLGFTSITDPTTTSLPRSVRRLAAVKQGLVGTAHVGPSADVIRISDGSDQTLATFARGPLVGIGGWPPMAGQSNSVVVLIRLDSPIDALLTDASGRRLGVDGGVIVNDFGINGFDSGPGEPRVFGVKGASAGDFTLRSVGTGEGPYSVHVYSMKLDEPAGQHIRMSGQATPGAAGTHDFTLADNGDVFFAGGAPEPDPVLPGKMAGDGRIYGGGERVTFYMNARVDSDETSSSYLLLSLCNYDAAGRCKGSPQWFKALTTDAIAFDDEPGVAPSADPALAGIADTVTYSGTGTYAGADGYRFEVTAGDRGDDPGPNDDTFHVVITAPDGAVVVDAEASLAHGNLEARPPK